MLNMIDTQDKLKNFSEQQLIQEMQRPSGSAPQFMVLGEIERRKRMRADAQKQEGLMHPTVAQEAVSAAGVPQQGIAQVAQSLAPKTDMTQNTGVPNTQAAGLPAQPNQPQRMADGGVLRLAPGGGLSGGTISAIANLKVKRPDIYEEYKDDPEALAMAAEYFQNVADTPERTGLESLEAPYVDPYGPQGLAQRTAAAEVGNQARMASEVAQQREIDRMLEINDPLGSGRRGAPLDAAARRRIAEEDMNMGMPVPRDDFRTFPVTVPQAKADPTYAEDEFFFNAGMFDRVAPENVAAQPRRSELSAISAAEDLRQRIAQEDAAMAMPIPQSDAAAARVNRRGADAPAAQGLAQFIEENRSAIPGYNLPGPSTPYVVDPDAAVRAGRSLSLQDQLLGLGFTGGDIDPSPLRIAEKSPVYNPGDTVIDYNPRNTGEAAFQLQTEQNLNQKLYTDRLKLQREIDRLAGAAITPDDFTRLQKMKDQLKGMGGSTTESPSTAQLEQAELNYGASIMDDRKDAAMAKVSRAQVVADRTVSELEKSLATADGISKPIVQRRLDEERAKLAAANAAFADAQATLDTSPALNVVEVPDKVSGGVKTVTKDTVATVTPEGIASTSSAAQEEFDQRPDTQDVKPAAEQKKIAAAMKTVTDPAAMPPAVKPRTGTRTGKKSGISAEKSKMDQDKWLALAQAGFTLMSTGDFGKAGSAGLAALRESGKADREERKLGAELMLREAQLAAANRAPAAKAIPAAYLTSLQKDKEDIQSKLASLSPPEEGGLFSSGSDPDAAARTRLQAELEVVNARINRMYSQYGLGASAPSSRRKVI